MAAVQRLMIGGQLRIEQLMGAELHDGQVLSWLKVKLAPGVAEPAHVHSEFKGPLRRNLPRLRQTRPEKARTTRPGLVRPRRARKG